MARLRLVVVLGPFLNLAVLADRGRREVPARGFEMLPERRVDAKDLACADALREKTVDDLMIHRRPHRQDADLAVGQAVPILWRHRWSADEAALRVGDQIIEEELRRFLHNGIGLREKRAIAAEEVV